MRQGPRWYRQNPGGTPLIGAKAGSKNPGQVSRTPTSNPAYQPDMVQNYIQDAAMYDNTINLPEAQEIANNSLPAVSRVQVDYTTFMFAGIGITGGKILIPRNPSRLNWYIANCGNKPALFTFGGISNNGAGPPSWGFYLPYPLEPNAYFPPFFSESNGAVGINDIVVYPVTAGDTLNIIGYEGIAALQKPGG
jgi:hypothetical protein